MPHTKTQHRTPDEVDELLEAFLDVIYIVPDVTVSSVCDKIDWNKGALFSFNKTREKWNTQHPNNPKPLVKTSGTRSLAVCIMDFAFSEDYHSIAELVEAVEHLEQVVHRA